MRAAHYAQVDAWLEPHLARRTRGEKHPIEDFLWDYYPFRPSQLRLWNPGPRTRLLDYTDSATALPTGFSVDAQGTAAFSVDALGSARRTHLNEELPWVARLLSGMLNRPAGFGCFGLHEWAMVVGQPSEQRRHNTWPMRVTDDEVRGAIDSVGLRCTHFDAWRFFTAEGLSRNPWTLSRAEQPDRDQGGCLHANMDVYKWAMRLQPLVPSELVVRAFDLAMRIRRLDMAASPYDFSALEVAPIPVETQQGRAIYAAAQREFAGAARQLRTELLEHVQVFEGIAEHSTETITA
jgi:hypothetical protein